jgi:hypothetical protein
MVQASYKIYTSKLEMTKTGAIILVNHFSLPPSFLLRLLLAHNPSMVGFIQTKLPTQSNLNVKKSLKTSLQSGIGRRRDLVS